MGTFLKGVVATIVGFLISASAVHAQSDDIYKLEGFAGYSYMQLHRGLDAGEFDEDFGDSPANRVGAHGFNLSGTYNFTKYLGAKFDFTYHKHRQDFEGNSYAIDQQAVQYMGGIQIKNNLKDGPKFKPFAHILAGAASQSFQIEQLGQDDEIVPFDVDTTNFAMKVGGGIDYKVHKNIDIRLIQVDWNPIWRGEKDISINQPSTGFTPVFTTIPRIAQQNLQFTFGVVFH